MSGSALRLDDRSADPTCPFCAIARGLDARAEIVAEEADWVAFFPLKPATPGHTLVIPRTHVANLWEASPQLGKSLMCAVLKVGHAVQEAMAPEGMNLITSSGPAAEQTVYHLHLHVVPRWSYDGFGDIWPPKHDLPGIDLDGVADKIREVWGRLSE